MKSVLTLSATLFVMLVASGAQAQWYTPSCTTGTLKSSSGNQFRCEVTTSTPASCEAGWTRKQNGTAKDKCEKTVEVLRVPDCQLAVGQVQANWEIKFRQGADHCEHKTEDKGQKLLKCNSGETLVQDKAGAQGRQDRCVKTTVESKDITCPSGSNHKVAGADVCETTTYSKPKF